MKWILLFLLIVMVQSVTVLKMDTCRDATHATMEFKVCEKLNQYEKYYFEDATGINQVTLVPDRLYRNHQYYTAYSTDSQIYIGKRLYKKEEWHRFRESFLK
tara:strand:+ start:590 stop:895 length:306 start_codon:yes stop_codon:yes gene_type:complete